MFTCPMQASLHCCDGNGENFRYLGVAAPFLHQGQQRAILGTELSQGVTQGVQLLAINGPGGFRDVFVLFTKREEYPPEFLAAKLVDARVAGEPEQPGFELRGRLQTIQGANHLNEYLLRQVLDMFSTAHHGVNKSCDPVLVRDNELPLGAFIAPLSSADQFRQRVR